MRAVVQRVEHASVSVADEVVGSIEAGLCILLGVARADTPEDAVALAAKIARARVFANEDGKFDLSLLDTGGGALVVSQFTLIADTTKGNRPSFTEAADPTLAQELYERFIDELRVHGVDVQSGRFGAAMLVEIANDGPVTLIIDR